MNTNPENHGSGALAGLAREVDALRREVRGLAGVPERVDELAALLARLADSVAALSARKAAPAAPSWLLAPQDPATTGELLDGLAGWLGEVFLRYPDGVEVLPECWCWHPDVVEELLWLMHAWSAAYQGVGASAGLAGDWHDRQRPGVVRRLKTSVGSCSCESHQTRPGWNTTPTAAAPVPGTDAAASIARWWAGGRDEQPPEPAHNGPGDQPWGGTGSAVNGTPDRTGDPTGHRTGDRTGWAR
jgi:hypothetical protein